jgi:ankyrin repeat protein
MLANFHALLARGDAGGAAALLQRAPGLANARSLKDGETPLHAAVRAKSLPLVQLLVGAGADARAVDREGRTPAEAAAADGAAGMAAWLSRRAE